jgi:hypothetical protein
MIRKHFVHHAEIRPMSGRQKAGRGIIAMSGAPKHLPGTAHLPG